MQYEVKEAKVMPSQPLSSNHPVKGGSPALKPMAGRRPLRFPASTARYRRVSTVRPVKGVLGLKPRTIVP